MQSEFFPGILFRGRIPSVKLFWAAMMFFIGITLEKDAFKVAILKKDKQSISIDSVHSFPYNTDNVKLFYNLPPFHTGMDTVIASGLSGSEVFIRKLHMPLNDKRKIQAALPFQLESLIPFSSEKPVLCTLLKPLSKQMTAVTIIATTKETLNSHFDALENLNIRTDVVSCTPNALMRFARWGFPQQNKILCFEVREGKLSCVVVEEKEIILSQTITFSKEGLDVELEKLSTFLRQKGVIDEKTPWLISGEIDFAEQISKIFTAEQLYAPEDVAFAVCIGLALDALEQDAYSVQFCQKEFTPVHTLEKRKKKALTYLSFCMGAALVMATLGSWMHSKKQTLLVDKLQSYLTPGLSKGSFSTVNQIEEKLFQWEKSLRGKKNSFAFVPDVPLLSDVLAWLSAHSSFATEDGGQKEGIEIKSLHYSLTKYPKIGEPSSPYFAQMQLEFSSSTPRGARDFHDALLKGDQIVNAKKEVKWQTQNQTYHAGFELNKGIVK